mgnify:CR=1 FL=1
MIIGYSIWRNRYGGDPQVVGRLTRINGEPAVIVGVMPEGFEQLSQQDLTDLLDFLGTSQVKH